MTLALVAGIITAVILVGAVLIYVIIRRRDAERSSSDDAFGAELTNIKVGFDEAASAEGEGTPDVKVSSTHDASKAPATFSRRFLALGLLAAGVFATLAARIWNLQVKSGQGYEKEAEDNLLTSVSTPAPRGCIYDVRG